MAAGSDSVAARVLTTVSWAAAAYLLALLCGYYLHLGDVRRHHVESASFILIALLLAGVISRRSGQTPAQGDSARPFAMRVLTPTFLALAATLYFFVLGSGLFADDYVLLEAARQGRLTVWSELFRPIPFVVWRTLSSAGSDVAPVLHVVNVALHAINGLLVCALAYQVGAPRWTGVAAGVLFISFPASVEAVAWPSGIQDVLMTTFVLGFLTLVIRPTQSPASAMGAVVLLVAALLTKETAVVAPALAATLCAAARPSRATWLRIAAATGVVVVFLAIRFSLVPLPVGHGAPMSRYAAKELLVRPFATLIVPFRESELSELPALGLVVSTLIVVTLCAAVSRWHRSHHDFHLALATSGLALLSIAPVYSYFHVNPDLHGSRYLYLSAAGWSMFLVTVLRENSPRARWAAAGLVVFVFGLWSIFSVLHQHTWLEAGALRDRILSAAGRAPLDRCEAWSVSGLPDLFAGVPLFINGFPEAMRAAGRPERFRIGPRPADGECRLWWTGNELAHE
ncbi:MAG: hypothetical protein ACRD15_14815 [Vicinamibacterales bacterium]